MAAEQLTQREGKLMRDGKVKTCLCLMGPSRYVFFYIGTLTPHTEPNMLIIATKKSNKKSKNSNVACSSAEYVRKSTAKNDAAV